MPGRKPKPTALKILAGNPGKRPLNRNEPHPTGTPTCPKHLDKAAKIEWRRISRELTSLGLLTNVDRTALAAYCAAYSRWANAEEQLQKFGHVIKSPKSGLPIPNPYLSVSNRALDHMRKFGTEFGLTPASRCKLSISSPAKTEDPFETFMRGIGGDAIEQTSKDEQNHDKADIQRTSA